MEIASRDAFLKHTERRYAVVDVPKIGQIRLQSLTDAEQRSIAQKLMERGTHATQFAEMAIACCVDENNEKLFGEVDIEKLTGMDSLVTQHLFAAISKFCGLGNYRPTEDDLKKSFK